MLEDVQVLVVDEESRGCSRLSALNEQLNAPNGLPRCRAELEHLYSILKAKDGRIDHAVQALKWPLKQGEMKKTVDYLKEFQQLLGSTLHVDNTWVTPVELQTDADGPNRRLVLEIHAGGCHIPMAARNIGVSDALLQFMKMKNYKRYIIGYRLPSTNRNTRLLVRSDEKRQASGLCKENGSRNG